MPRRRTPDITCSVCERPMWSGPGALPQGEATCPDCGGVKSPESEVCSTCRAARQRIRPDEDNRVQYNKRLHAAPGIRPKEREALLDKWKRRRARCSFCDELADTIDHVIPLVRGGTNYEGNLIPACRRCNSSKQARLIIEWRAGRKAQRTVSPDQPGREAKPKPQRIAAIRGEQRALNICPECGALCVNKYCDSTCGTRYVSRTTYRKRVGIPIDAPIANAGRPRGCKQEKVALTREKSRGLLAA